MVAPAEDDGAEKYCCRLACARSRIGCFTELPFVKPNAFIASDKLIIRIRPHITPSVVEDIVVIMSEEIPVNPVMYDFGTLQRAKK